MSEIQEGKFQDLFGIELSYHQITKELGLPKVNGSYHKQQMVEILRVYDVEKIRRNTYMVHRELTTIEKLEKETYQKNRAFIEPILKMMLSQSDESKLSLTMNELVVALSLVNDNFYKYKFTDETILDNAIFDKPTGCIKFFYAEVEPLVKRVVKDVLMDMQRKNLIHIDMIPVFAEIYRDAKTGRMYTKVRIATDEEIPNFLEAKRKTAKELGFEYYDEIPYHSYGLGKSMVARELGISYFYYQYDITLNRVGLLEESVGCEDMQLEDIKSKFNQHIQTKVMKSKSGNLKVIPKTAKYELVDILISTDESEKRELVVGKIDASLRKITKDVAIE